MTTRARVYLAGDFGAESGRVMAGVFDGRRLALREMHRFPNEPVRLTDGLHWDALRLFHELKNGARAALREFGRSVVSLGVDTWGVDFGLLDRRGALLGNPTHYRDARTDGQMERVFRIVPRSEIYRRTGIQSLKFNTLYQLFALARARDATLAAADTLLFMPDLFHYWLTGRRANEWTIASTSQCADPLHKVWRRAMLAKLGIDAGIFADIVEPGTSLGPLLPDAAAEIGARQVNVVAPAGHDTGSAVFATPLADSSEAYISSGTWSLMGVELPKPVLTPEAMEFNFTNEGGAFGTTRFLKNIMGLWIVQECRRAWKAAGQDFDYPTLTAMAAKAPPFSALVDVSDSLFFPPGGMPERVARHCRETRQRPPADPGAVVRSILEGLALSYRMTLRQIERVTGARIRRIHIIGGGSQNELLDQFTADATGVPVSAGPVEATAAGNVLLQMAADGRIASPAEGRAIIRRSFAAKTFEPRDTSAWDDAAARFEELQRKKI